MCFGRICPGVFFIKTSQTLVAGSLPDSAQPHAALFRGRD